MNQALEAGDLDEAVKAGLMDCIECGSCSYMCPARIKLTQRFRVGKQRLRMKQEQVKAASAAAAEAAKRMAENFKTSDSPAPQAKA
jgi:electron transport complex protein RnfC